MSRVAKSFHRFDTLRKRVWLYLPKRNISLLQSVLHPIVLKQSNHFCIINIWLIVSIKARNMEYFAYQETLIEIFPNSLTLSTSYLVKMYVAPFQNNGKFTLHRLHCNILKKFSLCTCTDFRFRIHSWRRKMFLFSKFWSSLRSLNHLKKKRKGQYQE